MRALLLSFALLAACAPTRIHVTTGGHDVKGAEVYVDGRAAGLTDEHGLVSAPSVARGAHVAARNLVYTRPAYRQNHGWTEHVYVTNLAIDDEGRVTDTVVADPSAQQEVALDPSNTLIGLHLMVSVQWDAAQTELDALQALLGQSADYLYDATDGQFFLEKVTLADDAQFWNDAEYEVGLDNTWWPKTSWFGGFLGPVWWGQPHTEMPRIDPLASQDAEACCGFKTWVHEFGHLGFSLMDEYLGLNVSTDQTAGGAAGSNYCTEKLFGTEAAFMRGGPKAACVMFQQWDARKFCSGHHDNPHRGGNFQIFDNCWNSILGNYADGNSFPRWRLKSPHDRAHIPGTITPGLPPQWRPQFAVTNGSSGALCPAFAITTTDAAGAPAARQPVVLELATGGSLGLGKSGDGGQLTVTGAHRGDRVRTPTAVLPVTCAATVR